MKILNVGIPECVLGFFIVSSPFLYNDIAILCLTVYSSPDTRTNHLFLEVEQGMSNPSMMHTMMCKLPSYGARFDDDEEEDQRKR